MPQGRRKLSSALYNCSNPPPGFAVPHQQYEEDFSSNIKVSRIATFQVFDDDRPEADLSKQINKELPSLLANGNVLPNKVRLLQGLDKVEEGYQLFRDNQIRGMKVVFKVRDN